MLVGERACSHARSILGAELGVNNRVAREACSMHGFPLAETVMARYTEDEPGRSYVRFMRRSGLARQTLARARGRTAYVTANVGIQALAHPPQAPVAYI